MDNPNGAPGAPEDAARRVKDSAKAAMDTAKDSARSAMDSAKGAASETMEQGKERLTGSVQAAASSLRRAAEDVQGEHAWMGAALRKSAESLESAATSLEGGDVSRALDNLSGFARRQPAVFLGASLALGFALSRVGKTALEHASPDGAGAVTPGTSTPEKPWPAM